MTTQHQGHKRILDRMAALGDDASRTNFLNRRPRQQHGGLHEAFYSRLFNHPDRAVALREAVVETRQRYPHPYYWAPFILVA